MLLLILVSRLELVLVVVLELVSVIALAPVSMSASVLKLVLKKAMRFQSRRKDLVTTSLRANFLFAGKALGLVSETSQPSPAWASRSAICARLMATSLFSFSRLASALESAFAHCDRSRGARHGRRRRQFLPA